MTAPIDELTEPTADDPVPDLVEFVIGAGDLISPSWWVGTALQICGIPNPWAWAAQEFGGDWQAVQRAGIALGNLGDFGEAVASTTTGGSTAVQADWDGNAADAAARYFDGLATTLRDQAADVAAMGREFENLAIGMYEAANAIKSLLELLTDELLAVGLAAAASSPLAATGVGAVVGGAITAALAAKAATTWVKVLDAHNAAWTGAQGTIGVIAGYTSAWQDLDEHRLPAAYDHPGVDR